MSALRMLFTPVLRRTAHVAVANTISVHLLPPMEHNT